MGVDGVRGDLGEVPVESVAAEPGLSWAGSACDHRLEDGAARLTAVLHETSWVLVPKQSRRQWE